MDHRNTTTPTHRHLAPETVMRIEVSLSSRRSSVVVFNTTARLVELGRGEWSSVAYGAPCIVLLRETTAQDSPFQVKFVIAELESGIAVWKEDITPAAQYTELQPGFHSFNLNGQTMAVQFADPSESVSFIDSLRQYMAQKEKIDQILDDRKTKSPTRKASKKDKKKRGGVENSKRVNKIDISLPCEFRHLSGITAGHTDVCQKELEGTIERHHRSASMGAIYQKQAKQRGRIPDEMTDGTLYQQPDEAAGRRDDTNLHKKRETVGGSNRGKFKFSSLRITKKKPLLQTDHVINKDDLSIGSPQHDQAVQISTVFSFSKDSDERNTRTVSPSITSPIPSENGSDPINTAVISSFRNTSPSHVISAWQEDNPISPLQASVNQKPMEVLVPLMRSPQRVPLQPLSPQHNKFPAYAAKKAPTVPNTYDMLEPLDNKIKPKITLSPPGRIGAPSLISKMTPLHRLTEQSNSVATTAIKELPISNSSSRVSLPSSHSSKSSVPPTTLSSLPVPTHQVIPTSSHDISPTQCVRTSSDLNQLTKELSKVLQDFDELIAPRSPFLDEVSPFSFQQPHKSGKETMV